MPINGCIGKESLTTHTPHAHHTHTTPHIPEYHSGRKKEGNPAMNLEDITLSDISQTDLLCMT